MILPLGDVGKVRALTELERLVGKEAFAVLEQKELIVKVASGKPSLARELGI